MPDQDQVRLLFKGVNPQERRDIILADQTHLRLRSGDIVAVTPEQRDWLMTQRPYRFWFVPTEAEPQLAVDSTDVAHDASVQLGGG